MNNPRELATKSQKKVLTVGVFGLLLGMGLCGLDYAMPGHKEEFGGISAFLGFVVCLASLVTLLVSGLWLGIVMLINAGRRDR